jgi:uncharacterized protein (TIRG00374 family)
VVETACAPEHGLRLRNGFITLALLAILAIVLLSAVPSLQGVGERITNIQPGWVSLAIVLELLSCLGYVVAFELVFYRLPRPLAARIAWSELAANTVLSVGGAGGLGLGAWVLRQKGRPAARIARHSVVLFLLTSAPSVGAMIIVGVGMAIGIFDGPNAFALTILPALIAAAAIVAVLLVPRWAAPITERQHHQHRRLAAALRALTGGVQESVIVLRQLDWRLLGAVGYWLFDVAVLWICFRALGHAPPLGVIVMGYLIGQLASAAPVPGGIGLVEGGLLGALLLYGVAATPAAAAILVYRAIALWLPALLGGIAFIALRRTINEPITLHPPKPKRN